MGIFAYQGLFINARGNIDCKHRKIKQNFEINGKSI